jgi:hypothetical protein
MPALRDLATDPAARRARKRPVEVTVQFAASPGVLSTREGDVRYAVGDALLTGAAGERWPVPRAHFDAAYEPVAPTRGGCDGTYRKRPALVLAKRMSETFAVDLSDARGTLRGGAGDWIVQYAPGDWAVVAGPIFAATYELLD